MKARLDRLAEQMKAKASATVEELVQTTDSPFTHDAIEKATSTEV